MAAIRDGTDGPDGTGSDEPEPSIVELGPAGNANVVQTGPAESISPETHTPDMPQAS